VNLVHVQLLAAADAVAGIGPDVCVAVFTRRFSHGPFRFLLGSQKRVVTT
jgi:hypothetical protein